MASATTAWAEPYDSLSIQDSKSALMKFAIILNTH